MRIASLRAPRTFEILEAPPPEIQPGGVLVRVAACGVCASELDHWKGGSSGLSYPYFLGHEVSGVIERAGSQVDSLCPGDPVAVWCTGRGFAEYVAVDAGYCFPAGDVPLELALGEPLACAVNAVELANLSLGDDVVIIGAGFMGNLVQELVGVQAPRHVIVADTRPDALQRASQMGATRVVDVRLQSLPEVVKEMTGGRGADASFEVTGAAGPLALLGEATRMSGKLVIVGFHQGGRREIPLAHWNWMAFQILNAHFRETGTILRGMHMGMRLLTSGRISMDRLVTHRYPLAEIGQAFQAAHDKPDGFVKATIMMES